MLARGCRWNDKVSMGWYAWPHPRVTLQEMSHRHVHTVRGDHDSRLELRGRDCFRQQWHSGAKRRPKQYRICQRSEEQVWLLSMGTACNAACRNGTRNASRLTEAGHALVVHPDRAGALPPREGMAHELDARASAQLLASCILWRCSAVHHCL